jgi:hypothetical protein
MTRAVVEALDWPGDRNLVAHNACYPDDVLSIAVEKYGHHLLGHNLASLVHFTRPIGGWKFEGYNWMLDRSVPQLDLSDVEVIPCPAAWGWPVSQYQDLMLSEPFAELVRSLIGRTTIEADEITYSTGAAMVAWMQQCYQIVGFRLPVADRGRALDTVAGWAFHFAGDAAVPHHAACVMLDGHAAFEGDMDEVYRTMEGSGEIAKLLKSLVAADNASNMGTLRAIIEHTANASVVAPCKLGWSKLMWRPGWNKLVKAAVLRALTASVVLGKVLMRTREVAP